MALVALHHLGASENRLREFVATLGERLSPRAADDPEIALAARHRRAIDDVGRDQALRAALAGLLPSLSSDAFHGVIRLGWALRTSSADEVAAALAAWEHAREALPLDAIGAGGRETELSVLVERLRASGIPRPDGFLITERLRKVVADPRFIAVARDLAVDGSTLGQVSGLGARWYLAQGDFASLHVLTGAHAVRRVRPWTDAPRVADRTLALAALACFVVAGFPRRVEARGLPRAEDKELRARTIASDDDHMAKLLVACLEEEEAVGDAIYRIVATHAVRRNHT